MAFFFFLAFFFRYSIRLEEHDRVDVVTEAPSGSLGLLYPFTSAEIDTSHPYKQTNAGAFAHMQTHMHAPRQRNHAARQARGAGRCCRLFCQTAGRGENQEGNACVLLCVREGFHSAIR